MTFPRYRKPSAGVVTVPKLCGGLNVRDASYGIADHQLADEDNLWWDAGALRTRPGLSPKDAMLVRSLASSPHYVQVTEDPVTVGGIHGRLLIATGQGEEEQNRLEVVLLQSDGSMVPLINSETYPGRVGPLLPISEKNDGASLGLLLSDIPNRPLLRMNADGTVTDVAPYIPTILLRATGNDRLTLEPPDGYAYESYNMLTDAFRIEYTVDRGAACFHLPPRVRRRTAALSLTCVGPYGTAEHTLDMSDPAAHLDGFLYRETGSPADGYRLVYSAEATTFRLAAADDDDYTPVDLSASPYVTLTATFRPADDTPDTRAVITGMRFGTWFGGDRSGTNGGTRFFVSGNPAHPNLVHYSSIQNATYFPENNYAYVGHPAQAVTALKKQGNMLVVFKEREIYYAAYQAGQTAAEDILESRVADVESAAAAFPLTPLSSDIGCDCPGSLALCGNQLVWLCRDKRVYTLQGTGQYSRRNVRPISAPIEPLLREHGAADIAGAQAVSVNGTFFLLIGHRMYLFRHGDIGFSSLASYADDETAGKNIAWYRWSLPDDFTPFGLHAADNAPLLLNALGNNVVTHRLEGDTSDRYYADTAPDLAPHSQTVRPIRARFCTRDFDFGKPEQRKHIVRLYLDLGEPAAGRRMTVRYRSENGDERHVVTLPADDSLAELLPNMRRVRRFGVRCEAEGTMACSGLVIRYERG